MMIIILSHLVNIAVAGFLGVLLWGSVSAKFGAIGARMAVVYGEATNARKILACLYLTIALASIAALSDAYLLNLISLPLFAMQIVYKALTLPSVGTIKHPVVVANIVISLLHGLSIYTILSA